MLRRARAVWAIGGMWVAIGYFGFWEPTGLGAQEVDLPAEDSPLSADFELVYRVGSTVAVAEWEQFSPSWASASTPRGACTCWTERT